MRLIFGLSLAAAAAVGYAAVGDAPVLNLRATTANVTGAPDKIRIHVQRWSTDAERDQLIDAWELKSAAPAAGRGAAGGAAAAGRGGGGGGRGAAGGRAGRGGRGGGGGAAEAPAITPEKSLATALDKVPELGYVWSSEVAGYTIRYAAKIAQPDGSARVFLLTDRRLGDTNALWKTQQAGPAYDFSLIELHLDAKGAGDGKASLSGAIAVDGNAKTIGLADYAASPVIFQGVAPAK